MPLALKRTIGQAFWVGQNKITIGTRNRVYIDGPDHVVRDEIKGQPPRDPETDAPKTPAE